MPKFCPNFYMGNFIGFRGGGTQCPSAPFPSRTPVSGILSVVVDFFCSLLENPQLQTLINTFHKGLQ